MFSKEAIAGRAVVLVDLAVIHTEGDETATGVAPQKAEHGTPDPRLGAAAPIALHPGTDQLVAVGTGQSNRFCTKIHGEWSDWLLGIENYRILRCLLDWRRGRLLMVDVDGNWLLD